MPFCPVCGTDIKTGQTFCDEHRPNRLDVKPFDIRLCACGRFFSLNHWFQPQDLEESILKVARDHTKQRAQMRIVELIIPEKRRNKGWGKIIATHEGEDYPIDFPVKLSICDKCEKVGTHYFTAKLQLRDPPEGVLDYIQEYMEPLLEKGMAINKVEDTPRGPDLYMTHKSNARQLAEKLVRRFGGTMKQSEQLFSRNKQTSKDLFRLNVVVEFAQFKVGDVLIIKGKPVQVTGLGKQNTGRDLSADKKVIFVAGEEEQKLNVHQTTVAITQPRTEAIDPEDFQQVKLENPTEGLVPGQKILVVKGPKKRLYLVT